MVDHRKALEMLWHDRCSVIVRDKVTDQTTKLTRFVERTLYRDQPCKLSFKALTANRDDSNAALVSQAAVLILGNEIDIPPGSKISVTKAGKVVDYESSGEPGRFTNHQEIPLVLFKGWA